MWGGMCGNVCLQFQLPRMLRQEGHTQIQGQFGQLREMSQNKILKKGQECSSVVQYLPSMFKILRRREEKEERNFFNHLRM